jgi:hypothetical protein
MEDQRTQQVSAVGVADSVRQWRADAGHIRNLAAQRHLLPEQRAVLQREADAADRQADWWADCLAEMRCCGRHSHRDHAPSPCISEPPAVRPTMSSRRTIPARAPDLTVVVGWDNPLSTFFAQVERIQDDDDPRVPILLWIGSELGEVAAAEQLAGPLAPYAELTSELVEQLRADRASDADRGPSVLQRTARSIFGRRS